MSSQPIRPALCLDPDDKLRVVLFNRGWRFSSAAISKGRSAPRKFAVDPTVRQRRTARQRNSETQHQVC